MINKILIHFLLFSVLGMTFQLRAQDKVSEVNGVVKDIYGDPLPGVIISTWNKKGNVYY